MLEKPAMEARILNSLHATLKRWIDVIKDCIEMSTAGHITHGSNSSN